MLSQRDDAVVYQGEGEKFARRLSKVIHGGQVVLSETAWASIQDQIPGQSQVSLLCLLSKWKHNGSQELKHRCRPMKGSDDTTVHDHMAAVTIFDSCFMWLLPVSLVWPATAANAHMLIKTHTVDD